MLSEEDKKLCALVKQHPQLYDKSHKDYGQQKATDEAWEKIAASLGKSSDSSKYQERWQNLGAAYTCKTKRNHDKPFYLAEYMEFLRPHLSKETIVDETLDSRISVNKRYNARASDNENLANEYFIKFILCHMLNMTPREQSIFRIRIWQNACKILEDGSSARSDANDDLKKTLLLKINTASEQELHDLEEEIQQKVKQKQTSYIKSEITSVL